MQNNENVAVIEVKDKFYRLILNELPDDIDIKSYLNIDVGNIVGEILTFPTFLNQIANLKTEIEHLVNQSKINLEITKANIEKTFKEKRVSLGLKCTVADVESYLNLHDEVQVAQKEHLQYQKNFNYVNGFYWSAQSKGDALMKISDKLNPEEFSKEILEKTINNIAIKKAII
jgi:hypothetical protein